MAKSRITKGDIVGAVNQINQIMFYSGLTLQYRVDFDTHRLMNAATDVHLHAPTTARGLYDILTAIRGSLWVIANVRQSVSEEAAGMSAHI